MSLETYGLLTFEFWVLRSFSPVAADSDMAAAMRTKTNVKKRRLEWVISLTATRIIPKASFGLILAWILQQVLRTRRPNADRAPLGPNNIPLNLFAPFVNYSHCMPRICSTLKFHEGFFLHDGTKESSLRMGGESNCGLHRQIHVHAVV